MPATSREREHMMDSTNYGIVIGKASMPRPSIAAPPPLPSAAESGGARTMASTASWSAFERQRRSAEPSPWLPTPLPPQRCGARGGCARHACSRGAVRCRSRR